jgi:hypothetical protein
VLATSVAYDVVLVVHIVAALTTVVVLVSLRVAADSVGRMSPERRRQRFPDRVDWAARVIHLVAASGLAMVLLGGPDVSLRRSWVATGVALYLAAAGILEARVLPRERELARLVGTEGPVEEKLGRELAGRLDVVLAIVAAAAVVMLWQF